MSKGRVGSAWATVAAREISDLWWAGKLPVVVIIFAVAMSGMTFLLASNTELRLIPPLDSVNMISQMAIVIAVLTAVIIGAGGIAGEREGMTLESLLLTPVSRHHILLGKFLAALSPWPVFLAVVTPYIFVIAPNADAGTTAVMWAAILGSLLVIFGAGLGLLISIQSSSNRNSLALSLAVIVLTLIPTQLPGTAQTGSVGLFFKKINPMESAAHLLEKLTVNNRTLDEMWIFIVAPVVAAVAVLLALFATPNLRLELEAKGSTIFRKAKAVRAAQAALLLFALAFALQPFTVKAEQRDDPSPLQVRIDVFAETVNAGDVTAFETVVTNVSDEPIESVVAAMNIINLDDGAPVDPEDWSDERTQVIEGIKPGESIDLDWEVNAILDGEYAIYVVALSVPDGEEDTSRPAATTAIHLTVIAHTEVNPGGVLPVVIGTPIALSALWFGLVATRRRRVKT